jgi:hypothetical protein
MMIAYTIVERAEKKYWVRCGAAFQNRDGSLNVRLDALPVNGMIQLRTWSAEDDARPRRSNGNGHHDDAVPAELFGG